MNSMPNPDKAAAIAAELAAAAAAEQAKADSWERSDTDGFLSQWASGLNANLHRAKAELLANDGMDEFPALFKDGVLVAAKLIETRYGLKWGVLASDDPAEHGHPLVQPHSTSRQKTRLHHRDGQSPSGRLHGRQGLRALRVSVGGGEADGQRVQPGRRGGVHGRQDGGVMEATYEVIAGNIGTVYRGPDEREATKVYDVYATDAMQGYGRVGYEPVYLLRGDDVIAKYAGEEEDYTT